MADSKKEMNPVVFNALFVNMPMALNIHLELMNSILDFFKSNNGLKTEEILEKLSQLLQLINPSTSNIWDDDRFKLVIQCIFINNDEILNVVIDILLKLPNRVASKYITCNHIIMYLRNLLKMDRGCKFSTKIMNLLTKCNESPSVYLKYHSYGFTKIFIEFVDNELGLVNLDSTYYLDCKRISSILDVMDVLNGMFSSQNRRKEMVDAGLINLCSKILIFFAKDDNNLERKLLLLKAITEILRKSNFFNCVPFGIPHTELLDALMKYVIVDVSLVSDCMLSISKLSNQRNLKHFEELIDFIVEQLKLVTVFGAFMTKSVEIAVNAFEILTTDLGLMELLVNANCYVFLFKVILSKNKFPQVTKSLIIIHRLVSFDENLCEGVRVHLLILLMELTIKWFKVYSSQKDTHDCFHKLALYPYFRKFDGDYNLNADEFHPARFSQSILMSILDILYLLIVKKNTIVNDVKLILTILNFVDLQFVECARLLNMCITVNNSIMVFQRFFTHDYLETLSLCNLYTYNRSYCIHCNHLHFLTGKLLTPYQEFINVPINYTSYIQTKNIFVRSPLIISCYLLRSKNLYADFFNSTNFNKLEYKLIDTYGLYNITTMLSAITYLAHNLCNHDMKNSINGSSIKIEKRKEDLIDFMAPIYGSNEGELITLIFPKDEKSLPVPKNFLIENMEFFKALYNGSYIESNSKTFSVTNYKYTSMLFLLRFIYTFVANDDNHNANEFMELDPSANISYEVLLMADFYGGKIVFDSLVTLIPTTFSMENFITYYKMIEGSGSGLLLSDIMCFFLHTSLTISEKLQIIYSFQSSSERKNFFKYVANHLWIIMHGRDRE